MPTTEKINLLRQAGTLDVAPTFNTYSKVVIHIDDDTIAEAGNDLGRTLEVNNPFGTQELAEQMLAKLRGYQYQPYYATGAFLDPAAEIGDGVAIKNTYGGIYQRERTFGRLMRADIAAPHDEEINHEYKFESPTERRFNRQFGNVKATLLIQAGLIEAKVSKESPEGQTSFSWSMDDTSHTWYANGRQIVQFNADGAEIDGKVTAREGYIGDGSTGFTIKATAIYNGVTGMSDTEHNGVYVGTDGIVVGKGAFRADSSGNVSANNMTLTGTLMIGGEAIAASTLRSGAQSAFTNGGYWSGGGFAGVKFDRMGNNTAAYPINASSLRVGGIQFWQQTFYVLDYNGRTRSVTGLFSAVN